MYTANPNIPTIPRSQVFLPSNEDFILFFDTENTFHLTGAKNISNVLTFTDYEASSGGGLNLINNTGNFGLMQVDSVNPNTSIGDNSTVFGYQNTESGSRNLMSGWNNEISTSISSTILGGNTNTITAVNASTIINSELSIISQDNSVIIGSVSSNISSQDSIILGGGQHIISGLASAIIGGDNNSVSGTNSVILGGTTQTETAANTVQVPNLRVNKKLLLKQGTNQISGQVTLSGGTVTLGNSLLSTTAKVFFSVVGASANQGFLHYVYSAPGASPQIVITSSNSSDTSVLNYLIIDAA